jgi:hypothetical protein
MTLLKILGLLALAALIPAGFVTVALTLVQILTNGVPAMAYLFIGLVVAAVIKIMSWTGKWTSNPKFSTLIIFAICWPLITPAIIYNLIVSGKDKYHAVRAKSKTCS